MPLFIFTRSHSLFFCFSYLFTESVKALLGRHTKILVKYMVKLETKGDKTDNRVLVSDCIRNVMSIDILMALNVMLFIT